MPKPFLCCHAVTCLLGVYPVVFKLGLPFWLVLWPWCIDLLQSVSVMVTACACACRRKEPIIAIGGGVCLDVAGLAANLYRRNTPLIKIPTTVMAAVDASIGIKTAVNFHGRKNKMGTYCAPLAVFIDKTFLKTLGDRHLSNGSAEILKMACIKDRELFELLEKHSAELIQTKFQVGILQVGISL